MSPEQYNILTIDYDYSGWYHYGARFYDPQIGRFNTLDPLMENFCSQTPFTYAANNPIRFIDWIGMAPDTINSKENTNDNPVVFTIDVAGNWKNRRP